MRLSHELQIGKAGEYLVCADLIIKGFVAYPSEQGLPYDIVLDNGKKMLRVQVKTCEKPRKMLQRVNDIPAYQFSIKKHGKGNKQIYGSDEVDIFALVALDVRKVGYVLGEEMKSTTNIRSDELRGYYYDERGIRDYKRVMELYKTVKNQSEIARRLNMHIAVVNRMVNPNYKPYITKARYFSDFIRDKEWFENL